MKLKARYVNGVLIPEKPIFPRWPTLTIEVADEDMEPKEGSCGAPTPVAGIEWTESERETFKHFPSIKKAWEIFRAPVRPDEMAGELSPKEAERWNAINFAREDL